MDIIETPIAGLKIIEPRIFEDNRGYFFESYNEKFWKDAGITNQWVQDNQSYSSFGTLRGIHLQKGDSAQAKLVRVLQGRVLDVAVDLRPDSPTFGQHYSVELTGENHRQFLVPRGFGHGFSVLSRTALFLYKCDNFYDKSAEGGIIYNDPDLKINWELAEDDIVLSEKDGVLPSFQEFKKSCF